MQYLITQTAFIVALLASQFIGNEFSKGTIAEIGKSW